MRVNAKNLTNRGNYMSLIYNKWTRAAIPALLLHGSIGTVYCWSLFKGEISTATGIPKSTLEWAFSLAIFFLGMSAAFLGNFVEQNISKASSLATICFVIGIVGTGLGVRLKSAVLILLFYGVIMGIGLGLGYLSPVKTLMLWFKDKKGLATGLAVAGFGAAKMVFSPVIEFLMGKFGVEITLYILAAIWFVMMYVGHLFLKKPVGWEESHERLTVAQFFGRFKIFKDIKFIGIWLVFYINITCGLALISQEKQIYKFLGLGSIVAILSTITGLLNAAGRLGYSSLGDKFKDRNTIYKIILLSEIIFTAVAFLSGAVSGKAGTVGMIIAVALLFVVNAGYGGGFSNLPTLLSDVYGMGKISSIHGIALSAWAFAGLTGNQAAQFILDKTNNNYQNILIFTGVLYVIAILIDFLLIRGKAEQE